MKIELRRRLDALSGFDCELSVGWTDHRPDLLAVLLRAQELGGTISPQEVSDHLLLGRPLVVGKAILRRCSQLGLLASDSRDDLEYNQPWGTRVPSGAAGDGVGKASNYSLTSLGNAALESQAVFIPESGRYRVFISKDPLLSSPLVDIVPIEEHPLIADVKGRGKGAALPSDPSEGEQPTPAVLKAHEGKVVNLARKQPTQALIVRVGARGVPVPDYQIARTDIRWTLGPEQDPTLELTGGFTTDRLSVPKHPWGSVWRALLADRAERWAAAPIASLATEFADTGLTSSERMNLNRTLTFEHPDIPGYGQFERTQVRGIPLRPISKSDAEAWAAWILENKIDRHVTKAEYARIVQEVIGLFPGFGISLPGRADFANTILKRERARVGASDPPKLPPAYWFSQTLLDVPQE